MHKLDMLDKETSRLHELLKSIQSNKNKEDKVWENFCKEMSKEKGKETKKYFKRHPKHISNSSSEILSPRSHIDHPIKRAAKSANSIKFSEPINATPSDNSDTSTDVVTIRDELVVKKNQPTKSANVLPVVKRSSVSRDNRRISRDSVPKQAKMEEKLSQGIIIKKSSKQIKDSKSETKKEEKLLETHKDNYEIKLHNIVDRCLTCMEDIRIQLEIGITPPDGMDDLERRKRRSSEFASRFCRNYLYQLNRQISDIRKLLKPCSARTNFQNSFIIRQKLTSSYQTVLQGLQAYFNHLPISTPLAVPEKVKDLLREIPALCEIQKSFTNTDENSNGNNNDLVDIFETRSHCLIETIDECYSSPTALSLLQSHSKFSLLDATKTRKQNNMKSRFSMYNGHTGPPNRKDVYWKRAVAALAKKKFNVRSRYKTASFKHRPPAEKPLQVKPLIKAKPLERKSSGNLGSKSVIDDDNIKTMMEIQREKDQQMGIQDSMSYSKMDAVELMKSDTLIPLVDKLVDKLNTYTKEVTQDELRCILKGLTDNGNQTDKSSGVIDELASQLLPSFTQEIARKQPPDVTFSKEELVDKLVEVIWNHSKEKSNNDEQERASVKVGKKKKKERKKTVTVTGAKNAQLICIKDEDSLNETLNTTIEETMPKTGSKHLLPENPQFQFHNEVVKVQNNEDGNLKQTDVQQPTNIENVKKVVRISSADRTSRMKISRLPKTPLSPLKMLPKKFALNILEYKINYLKARKGNHMYKRSAVKQPWILMGEISDKILDQLLQDIGTEIQVDHVIDGIFASEFV